MAWKVVTLKEDDFAAACRELESTVLADGFTPDAVLSIATGGVYVGRNMFDRLPHYSTESRRPSTSYKKRIIRIAVRLAPRFIQNRLRILEADILERKRHKGDKAPLRKVTLPADLDTKYRKVLIVDDAVDSGHTLKSVYEAVRRHLPDAMIRTAVITMTMPDPELNPDYALYRDRTLIRFPWSMDA